MFPVLLFGVFYQCLRISVPLLSLGILEDDISERVPRNYREHRGYKNKILNYRQIACNIKPRPLSSWRNIQICT